MKKIIFSLMLASSFSFASEYYAKLEPVVTYDIKSSVSGKVEYVNDAIEGKQANESTIIKIDNYVNKIDLKYSKEKLDTLEKILAIEEDTLKSYNKVSSKSKFDKDTQKVKILNIVSSISDLQTKIKTLEDTIKNKILEEKSNYIYDISVEEGDYVNPGSALYTAMDLSSGKLSIFIPLDEASTIKEKTIYIDGEKSNLTISKLYDVADSKHISSYKCEIIVPNPKSFSKLVKIEFK